jgi:linoleoyl-CoA desaturase
VHQLQTTSNFAVGNRFVTEAIGGLNYQIEHHLFPSMCHVLYPEIAPIVQQTCEEFGLPYHQLPTVKAAVKGHFTVLKNLGN